MIIEVKVGCRDCPFRRENTVTEVDYCAVTWTNITTDRRGIPVTPKDCPLLTEPITVEIKKEK